ncbi:unnamed protein product [Nippostrongylus brasiliensis]|uniref:Uncharacterized protein n=1 Tax=Nippostrongylus brasiliensis TaxID=27835 RepID=A0A3P7A446_NIPBR|nr:unnamed protein product [Nippostrongylus brasiliensis]
MSFRTATALPSPVDRPTARALSVPAYFNRGYRPFYSSTDTNSNLYIPEGQRAPLTLQVQRNLMHLRPVRVI